ncbi:oxidase [Shewanella sp. OPT22]|nr:oxidase [Shewanella sp. OPT22]
MTVFKLEHRTPTKLSEKVAYKITQSLKFILNVFYGTQYAKRAVILETIAAVPGMVAGMFNHLKALRRMKDDGGWIRDLLDEAENERMHLMIFLEIAKPSWVERLLVFLGQGAFILVYGFIYLFTPKIAHRIVGYFEEEACKSYSDYIEQVDLGNVDNIEAPVIAINYYGLSEAAKLKDVLLAVREDEAKHRDNNHAYSDAYESNQLPEHQN